MEACEKLVAEKVFSHDTPNAEELSSFFSEAPIKVSNDIPPSHSSFASFLDPRRGPSFSLAQIGEEDLSSAIDNLQIKKSSGHDSSLYMEAKSE